MAAHSSTANAATGCPDFRGALRLSRRDALCLGGLGALGLGLPGLLRAEQLAAVKKPRAKSVLLLYCFGGPSHLDMWDMKPDGPSAIRGEFQPIATRLTGTVYCEHLPQLATRNDRFTLVRTVTHDRNVHGGAVGYTLTGTRTSDPGIPGVRGPDAGVADHPAMGSVVNKLSPSDQPVPSAITLPWDMIDGQGRYVPGQNAGLLGGKFDPWFVNSNPNDPKFRMEGLSLPGGMNATRLNARRSLLDALNDQSTHVETIAQMTAMDAYYDKAFTLLTSSATQQAFDLSGEPAALRDRYGRNLLCHERYEWVGKGQEALQHVQQVLRHLRLGVVQARLDDLQVPIAELGPKEPVELVRGRRQLVAFNSRGDRLHRPLEARNDPGVGRVGRTWASRGAVGDVQEDQS